MKCNAISVRITRCAIDGGYGLRDDDPRPNEDEVDGVFRILFVGCHALAACERDSLAASGRTEGAGLHVQLCSAVEENLP